MRSSIRHILRYSKALSANGVGLGIALLTQILLARSMGSSNYGILTLSVSLVMLGTALLDFGITSATPRFIAKSLGENNHSLVKTLIRKSGLYLAIISTVMTGLFLLLSSHLAVWFNMANLQAPLSRLSMFVPLIYLHLWCLAMLKGLGQTPVQIFMQSPVLHTLICAFSYGAWHLTESVTAAVTGQGVAYAATGCISFFTLQKMNKKLTHYDLDREFSFRSVISHGIPINMAAVAQRLFRRTDIIMIGFMLGEAAVGMYKAAFTIASGAKQLVQPVNSFAVYYIANRLGRKRIDQALEYYDFSTILTLTLTLPLYLFFMSFSDEIMYLLYGHEYLHTGPILFLLCLGFCVFVCIGPLGSLFNALGRNWTRFWMVVAICLCNIGLNFTLITKMGLAGAAIATSLSFVLLYILFMWTIRDVPGRRTKRYAPSMFLLLATFYTYMVVEHFKSDGMILNLGITVSGCVFVFTLCTVFLFSHLKWLKPES